MAGYFAGHQVICQRPFRVGAKDGAPEGLVDFMALAAAQWSARCGIPEMCMPAGTEL